ncbi:MAG: hypothetical protein HZB34_05085 [Nitrospirae bacterium]|nr:hypothetical protein [Nitrospirota bacterium]
MNSEHSPFTIDHLPFNSPKDWEQNLRDLTAQAGQAAELGRWDLVEECYRLRGEQLRNHSIPSALATDLTRFDRMVEARILNVRAAVQSQLIESAKVRMKLQGIRSWQSACSSDSTFMDRQA